jgi:hypothetical protein
MMGGTPTPPVFVSGGKRLNFDREEDWGKNDTYATYADTFAVYGKDESCFPSCSWEELCALAKLVTEHPAFRLPEPTDYYPPRIVDKPPLAPDTQDQ